MNRTKNLRFPCLLLSILISASVTFPAFASDNSNKKEVKVAYFDLSDYYITGEDGSLDSFDSAYLNEVSGYTDYYFTYVYCGTWSNALKKLENHEVDLVGTMQWTLEREERYEICDTSYGYTVAELAAKADSKYIYEDYTGINGATVGYIDGYVIADQIKDYMQEKNISFKIKTYQNQTDLENALESGDIDLIAANSHAIHDEWTLIEKFHYAPMYFASWKGNSEVIEEISEALVKIMLHEPEFNNTQMKKYFSSMSNSPFVKEELECIKSQKTYNIYFDSETKPIAWFDSETNTMAGILVDVCKDLEDRTGLQFNYKPFSEKGQEEQGNYAFYSVTDLKSSALNRAANETAPIAKLSFSLYHKKGKDYDSNKAYSIAYVKNRGCFYEYLQSNFPKCTLNECDTPKECLELVQSGKADLAFINTSIADNIIFSKNIINISSLPTTNVDFGISLIFNGNDAELLTGIVNKGIRLTDDNTFNQSMLKYALESKPDQNLFNYIQNHPLNAAIIVFCVVILFVTFVLLLFYVHIMRKDKQRVDAVSKERANFFSRMSHDMRTPMNGILGLTNLSKDETDTAVLKDTLKKIDESGQYLLGLINDTLDYQKIDSGKMELVPEIISTEELIRSSVHMIRESAEQKGISFSVKNKNARTNGYIYADPKRIKQLFVNLLSNAIKFTPAGGSVELGIEVLDRSENKGKDRITVTDTGIGMSEDFIKNKLYKPFSQENSQITSQYAGTGLGLSIVKQIADIMGAKISVESKLGEGTKFTVDVELEFVDDETAKKYFKEKNLYNAVELKTLNGTNILLAEDHPLNAEIAQKMLIKNNCSVSWAKDGKECVDLFSASKEGEIDAVLMDIRMPVLDGLEATKAIRNLDRADAKTVPIIAMSANAYEEDVNKSLLAGMNAHLAKPIEPKTLYETLAIEIEKAKGNK